MSEAPRPHTESPLEPERERSRRQHLTILIPYAVTGLLLLGIFANSPNFVRRAGPDEGLLAGDFLQEWIGGQIVRTGQRERLYDPAYAMALEHDPQLVGFAWDESEYLPMVYPPFLYALVGVFSTVPYGIAASLWAATMTATIIVSSFVLRAWLNAGGESPRTRGSGPWLLPAFLIFPPVIECLISGQKGGLCLLLIAGTCQVFQIGSKRTAGLLFGLLLFKPQFTLVFVPVMIWRREWRFLTGFAITALLLMAISLGVGWQVCGDYARFLGGAANFVNTSGYDLEKSHSLYGALALFFGGAGPGVRVLTGAGVLLILGRLFWHYGPWRFHCASAPPTNSEGDRAATAFEFAVLTLTTLLISPHLLTYDLAILLFPCLTLCREDVRTWLGSRWRPLIWTAAALLSCSGLSPLLAAQSGVQLTTVLMVALWAGLLLSTPGPVSQLRAFWAGATVKLSATAAAPN